MDEICPFCQCEICQCDDPWEDEETFDCGIYYEKHGNKMVAAGCSLAGSEDCDFECPNRNALYRSLESNLRKREREEGLR